jgi:hypothetical protein
VSKVASDDQVLEEWFSQIRNDESAKRQIAAAVRAKEATAIDTAVQWVLANVLKPAKDAWDRAASWVRSLFE